MLFPDKLHNNPTSCKTGLPVVESAIVLTAYVMNSQVQMLLRLYTSLLPSLRQAALQSIPAWAAGAADKDGLGLDMNYDHALAASIRREAAAVLNVGRVFHSEGAVHSSLCFASCLQGPLTPNHIQTVLTLYTGCRQVVDNLFISCRQIGDKL